MKKQKSAIIKGLFAIVALTAVIALANVLARYLDTGFTVLQQVYLRVFAALLLALLIFNRSLRWRVILKIPVREWGVIAFRGVAGYVIGVVLMTQAVTLTTIANVTFIAALPFVPLLGFVFLKEKVTWWKLAFIFGSLFGVAMLATNGPGDLLSWNSGDMVAVVATFGLALSYVARKWHGKELNNQEITTLTFVFGAASVLVLSLAFGEGAPPLAGSWALWAAVWIAGVINVAKLFLTNYGFERVDAVRGGNLLTLEGAWGLLFGWLFYQEWPTAEGLLGGLIVVACVIGLNVFSRSGHAKMASPPESGLKRTA